MTHRIRDGSRRGRAQGFTLVELLTAMAIFTAIMGGVGVLFASSIRTIRQGFQNQEAFELARGTLNIIESDLSRAFTSRERGDLYKFYGTPIGFTFVGLVGRGQSTRVGNLARVTYVVYHDNDPPVLTSTGDRDWPTFKLLRYVEPRREDLDDFPVIWYPAGGGNEGTFNLGALIDRYCQCRGDDLNPSRRTREAINAAKRELWIRMLSGGDADVPSAWDDRIPKSEPFPEGPPEDYVVAENLLHVYRHPSLFDRYDSLGNLLLPGNGIDDDGDGVPDEPAEQLILASSPRIFGIFDGETVSFQPTRPIPLPGYRFRPPPTYFFSYRDFRPQVRWINGILQRDPITGKPVVDIVPVDSRFWNDMRNAFTFADGRDFTTGSPLAPALPQSVGTFFTFFFESPAPKAPDFMRSFDQQIDIPTGYRRLPPL